MTTDFASEAARRKKLVTALVAGALAATLSIVALALWRSSASKEQSAAAPQSLPSNVHQQLSGYSFTRSFEGRRVFTVHAARTVAFKQGGTTVLEDVYVEVFGHTGNRRDLLRTRRCEYNAQSGDLFSSGRVEIELNTQAGVLPGAGFRGRQAVHVETSQVFFKQQGSLVVSDEPVEFRAGPTSGSARGLTYATSDGWLELKKDVRIELRPRGGVETGAPLVLTAPNLRFDRESGEVKLRGPVEITHGNQRVVAGRSTILLNDQNRVTRAVLEEGVQASEASRTEQLLGEARRVEGNFDPVQGELRKLVAEGDVKAESKKESSVSRLMADRLEMNFAGTHPCPLDGDASGNVRLSLESQSMLAAGGPRRDGAASLRSERKKLQAGEVRFTFRPEGRVLSEAQTVGPGELTLVPREARAGERVITADRFLMSFDDRNRLETLRGVARTRIVFRPPEDAPAGTPAQESSADRLSATFDPASQSLLWLEQSGNYRFREGDRQASAERARYSAESDALTLTGQPVVWDLTTHARAERILLDLRADTAEGVGKVQASHFENSNRPGDGSALTKNSRQAGDPTNVVADRMVAERRSQVVHYEGHVRVWHGQDVVESASLDVSRTERRVSSGSKVLTSHLQPASLVATGNGQTPASARETRPVTIRAERLDYFEQGRKAAYRGNVRLETQNTTLHADRIDVYFSPGATVESSEVERALADGHVKVVQPRRRATGEHAEYFAAVGKIVMTGGPPSLYDEEKGLTTGRSLTFFIHDDTLLVDGGDETPTISRHRISR